MTRLTLRFYAVLFAAAGVFFVAGNRFLLDWIGRLCLHLGIAGLPPCGLSFWLGLSGSLMTVIAFLAWRLSENPGQDLGWDALLLAKAVSAALFFVFAAVGRNVVFAAAGAVDAAILAHLAFLRFSWENSRGEWEPRLLSASGAPFYETWFARVNDVKDNRAVWLRYSLRQGQSGLSASCWAVFFGGGSFGAPRFERWEGQAALAGGDWVFRMGESGLKQGLLEGKSERASWRLRWKDGGCPGFSVAPLWLRGLGIVRSGYRDAAPAAFFDGFAELGGERWEFSSAPGDVGHVWGRRYGRGWRWAHAIFERPGSSPAVFEILSAPGPLGLAVTAAYLWRDGRLFRSCGPLRLWLNSSQAEGGTWNFRARFCSLAVRGSCELGPTAALRYDGPDGNAIVCRNSKLSTMRLRLEGADKREEWMSRSAACEFAERS